MAFLESPGSNSPRDLEPPKNFLGWVEAQSAAHEAVMKRLAMESEEAHLTARALNRKKLATSNHKGVHFKRRSKKFVARLCLPGGKSQKLDLGEYSTVREAARAYRVGAFYYHKPLPISKDDSFLDSLLPVPDNLSAGEKSVWVREQARQSAATVDTSERPPTVSASRSVQLQPLPVSCTVLEADVQLAGSGYCSSEALPSTPGSYGTQASCGDYNSPNPASLTPTTSGSAAPDSPFNGFDENVFYHGTMFGMDDFSDMDLGIPPWAFDDRQKRNSAAALHISNEITGFKRRKLVRTRSHVELQQGGDATQTPVVVEHQAVSQFKMTDSILLASCELRKQGWEWTLKSVSSSSVKAGVLFSVPQGQQAAPALVMTDIIINSFYELCEQGWEVHLEPSKCDNIEGAAAAEAIKAYNLSVITHASPFEDIDLC